MLEGQSSSIVMLAKAIRDHNEPAFKQHAERLAANRLAANRLAANRGRVEELLWVLGEKAGQSVFDLQVVSKNSSLSVKEVIEKLRVGELKMDDLSPDAQAMVRKVALELKNTRKG